MLSVYTTAASLRLCFVIVTSRHRPIACQERMAVSDWSQRFWQSNSESRPEGVQPKLPSEIQISRKFRQGSPSLTHLSKSVTCCAHFTHFSVSLIGPVSSHTSLNLSLVAPILHTSMCHLLDPYYHTL